MVSVLILIFRLNTRAGIFFIYVWIWILPIPLLNGSILIPLFKHCTTTRSRSNNILHCMTCHYTLFIVRPPFEIYLRLLFLSPLPLEQLGW